MTYGPEDYHPPVFQAGLVPGVVMGELQLEMKVLQLHPKIIPRLQKNLPDVVIHHYLVFQIMLNHLVIQMIQKKMTVKME